MTKTDLFRSVLVNRNKPKKQMTLFNKKEFEHENIDKKCNSCMFRERWAMGIGLETSQYCSVRPSNRTKNGLLKIKASDAACPKYFHSITKPKLK